MKQSKQFIDATYWFKKNKNSISSQFILDPGNSGFTNNNYNYNNNNIKKKQVQLDSWNFQLLLPQWGRVWLSKCYFPEAGVCFGPVGILRIYSVL